MHIISMSIQINFDSWHLCTQCFFIFLAVSESLKTPPGSADEAPTILSFPFIFQAYPPTIKQTVVSPVDTSLLIPEIR
mgnify:CR=1 FL=1